MRITRRWLSILALLMCGCTSMSPPPTPAPPFTQVVELKQLMEWVIDPATDVIWDSTKTIINAEGTREIAPRTQEEWDVVRNAAATVAEAGNLLMIEGRARDRKQWMNAARGLTVAATRALKAAEAKNTTALFDAGGDIYNACSACHARYAAQLNQ